METNFDVLIVGMGPAGLSACSRLGVTNLRVAIVDSGKAVYDRDRQDFNDATKGHGGAGLFSDGKFSFFPSASELWSLRGDQLRKAYEWTCSVLQAAGLDTPPFPQNIDQYSGHEPGVDEWILKAYPSDYLSLDSRLKFIDGLVASSKATIFSQTNIRSISHDQVADLFRVETESTSEAVSRQLTVRRVIMATGRFGPLQDSLKQLATDFTFRRLEVGFRIQQHSDKAFFRGMKQLDPKLRIKQADGSIEWRTFCVCRRGETCLTKTGGLWTVSGRSDCPPTGLSNCGFNSRITDSEIAEETLRPLLESLSNAQVHYKLQVSDVLKGDPHVLAQLDRVYGPKLRELMVKGLTSLANSFEDLASDVDAELIGPTLEGIGWYPKVDTGLRLLNAPVWVAGDACGLFRGIVAAMISGHYAATGVLEDLNLRYSTVSCDVCDGLACQCVLKQVVTA
ncbi:FAD/NAD(P)-binding domain-containing protein [Annulohypoxylon truncatum]|uniref:FAD/NAD(P)-binding domain-containing protein n=1 Tax=Annulohypoxylon truncatum TaxID=327061 RepID=UPI0020088033|nr:FAD/NAD(P)-binding domain-containing protein [Annulohypoxylon truncatum]KAI1211227.1 FAD/NAD(P)-binding domain-containing protein [Annulohypoxylon truncatum]